MRFRASLMAMRRISWIDQRISDGVVVFLFLPGGSGRFFGAGALARCRMAAVMAKASITSDT